MECRDSTVVKCSLSGIHSVPVAEGDWRTPMGQPNETQDVPILPVETALRTTMTRRIVQRASGDL
jgi:hypothetical protein